MDETDELHPRDNEQHSYILVTGANRWGWQQDGTRVESADVQYNVVGSDSLHAAD